MTVVMERAQQNGDAIDMKLASSVRGPRRAAVGGAQPGAERLETIERLETMGSR
jgi:hypothetical protein